jgi:hypothetical protein
MKLTTHSAAQVGTFLLSAAHSAAAAVPPLVPSRTSGVATVTGTRVPTATSTATGHAGGSFWESESATGPMILITVGTMAGIGAVIAAGAGIYFGCIRKKEPTVPTAIELENYQPNPALHPDVVSWDAEERTIGGSNAPSIYEPPARAASPSVSSLAPTEVDITEQRPL